MSKLIKKINNSDCVGDSLGKHNYNYSILDQNICDLSSRFFNNTKNYNSIFTDLSANIEKFNIFADYFETPTKLNEATTATFYVSSFWQKRDIHLTFPINIYQDSSNSTKFYLDENSGQDLFKNWGVNKLKKTYPEYNFNVGTIAHISFFLYSNLGKIETEDKNSVQLISDLNPNFTYFKVDGEYTVPAGITSIDVVLVGGGGGGGGDYEKGGGGGGGGGGVKTLIDYKVTEGTIIPIKIGAGGNGGNSGGSGGSGGTTQFANNTVTGGSGGKSTTDLKAMEGGLGGSPGAGNLTGSGGSGQGTFTTYRGKTTTSTGVEGATGTFEESTGKVFGGGGGGGNCSTTSNKGGDGGGGKGGHNISVDNKTFNTIPPYNAEPGVANTGGGGGGAAKSQGAGAKGGSGVVIIKQKTTNSQTQTNKIFNVNNTKDDIYIKQIKIGKFIIDPISKNWTFSKIL